MTLIRWPRNLGLGLLGLLKQRDRFIRVDAGHAARNVDGPCSSDICQQALSPFRRLLTWEVPTQKIWSRGFHRARIESF